MSGLVNYIIAAQTYVFDIFAAFTDRHLPALDRACPGGIVQSAAPIVYDKTLLVFFTCVDGSVTARRYFNVHDLGNSGTAPIPVYVVPQPVSSTCQVPGMVTGIRGGCVPPDHPDAPRLPGK